MNKIVTPIVVCLIALTTASTQALEISENIAYSGTPREEAYQWAYCAAVYNVYGDYIAIVNKKPLNNTVAVIASASSGAQIAAGISFFTRTMLERLGKDNFTALNQIAWTEAQTLMSAHEQYEKVILSVFEINTDQGVDQLEKDMQLCMSENNLVAQKMWVETSQDLRMEGLIVTQ